MSTLRHLASLAVFAAVLTGCGRWDRPPPTPAATRGSILISLDALRPDHLGAYGHSRPTSPFLDSLAARGALFENAFAQYPSTLASHVTMLTGLYPQEHGTFRPDSFLNESILTLPEQLRAAGWRTAGFTEGGFMAGAYGFERGFERFDDTRYRADTDVERTFRRGVEFLESLDANERFFLFLHTYSIHDPYAPPEGYLEDSWPGEPPTGVFESTGANLRAVNRGELPVTPEIVAYLAARYDATIRYVDDVLAALWADLERLGLTEEITLMVTSDHGEAFYEHGTLAHAQVYPEELRVPLIVTHPGLPGGTRVTAPVGLVDLAPTLYQLTGVEPPHAMSGLSLAPYLLTPDLDLSREAYGEALDRYVRRTLVREQDGGLYQILLIEPEMESEGMWITREVRFQTGAERLDFEAHSFHEPRTVQALVDGRQLTSFELGTDWQPVSLELPPGGRTREVVLATPNCLSPPELGASQDDRCLSFRVRGMPLRRTELYDLVADPAARRDIASERPDLHRLMLRRLLDYRFTPSAARRSRDLAEETAATLRDLGYLND